MNPFIMLPLAVVLLFVSSSAIGEIPKGSLIEKMPTTVLKYEVAEFKPIAKHHFELKAPISCDPGVVVSSEKETIKCQFQVVGISTVNLSICDDNKEYCKPENFKIEVQEIGELAPKQVLSPALLEMKDELHDQLLPDFVSGSPEEIRERLFKDPKPVFLMISTDWCPPCNQSKEYLLSTVEFQEMTKGWLKVYVDGDSKDSRLWNSVAPFNFYPSMVLLNSELKEVSRFQSEFTQKEFKNWMDRQQPFLDQSYEYYVQRVLNRRQGNWFRLALQNLKDFFQGISGEDKILEQNYVIETAVAKADQKVLDTIKEIEVPKSLKYDWYQVRKDQLLAAGMSELDFVKKSMALSENSPAYLSQLGKFCELDKASCSDLVQRLSSRPQAIQNSPERTETEKLGALGDEYFNQMSFFKDFKDQTKMIESAKSCVQVFEKIMLASKLRVPRYGEQGILACAKNYDLSKVEAIYKKMMAKYPEDPTFVSRYARFLKDDRKDLKKAKVWAEKAMDLSYDYNWFPAATMKVQIDKALGQSSDAKKTIKEAFSGLDLSQDPDSLDQKIAARLRKLEAE